jgi:hypothetical protein
VEAAEVLAAAADSAGEAFRAAVEALRAAVEATTVVVDSTAAEATTVVVDTGTDATGSVWALALATRRGIREGITTIPMGMAIPIRTRMGTRMILTHTDPGIRRMHTATMILHRSTARIDRVLTRHRQPQRMPTLETASGITSAKSPVHEAIRVGDR